VIKFKSDEVVETTARAYVGWGKILGGGFCLYLHVISFDFDSGVSIPVTLTFWPWGARVNTLANPTPQPTPMREPEVFGKAFAPYGLNRYRPECFQENTPIVCVVHFFNKVHIRIGKCLGKDPQNVLVWPVKTRLCVALCKVSFLDVVVVFRRDRNISLCRRPNFHKWNFFHHHFQ